MTPMLNWLSMSPASPLARSLPSFTALIRLVAAARSFADGACCAQAVNNTHSALHDMKRRQSLRLPTVQLPELMLAIGSLDLPLPKKPALIGYLPLRSGIGSVGGNTL